MESKSPLHVPIQFSIRTLVLATTNVAIVTAIGQTSDQVLDGAGKLLKVYALLLTFYLWRYAFIRSQLSTRNMWLGWIVVLALSVPYMYLCIGSMFNEPFGLPASKWVGTPIWLIAIPFCSFLMFDVNHRLCSVPAFITRSLIELIVVFHVWTAVWGFIQLMLGWAWI